MQTSQMKLGNSTIKWKNNGDGSYSGVVIAGGKPSEHLHDVDEDRLIARLKNEAGALEPNYFGIEAAIARFCEFMPQGFEGKSNVEQDGNTRSTRTDP